MMKEFLVPLLVGVFFCIGAYSGNSMFEKFNRPQIFWSKGGEFFLNFMNLSIILGSIGLVVWSFMNAPWYFAVGFSLLGIICGVVFIGIFRQLLISAIGLILSFSSILTLHWWAWFF
jgi:hypothetical protein